jgi:hypothetical protein
MTSDDHGVSIAFDQELVAVDDMGYIFHTLHHVNLTDIRLVKNEPGLIYSRFTGNSPCCVVHGNGDGLETFHELSRRLRKHGWPPAGMEASTNSFVVV